MSLSQIVNALRQVSVIISGPAALTAHPITIRLRLRVSQIAPAVDPEQFALISVKTQISKENWGAIGSDCEPLTKCSLSQKYSFTVPAKLPIKTKPR